MSAQRLPFWIGVLLGVLLWGAANANAHPRIPAPTTQPLYCYSSKNVRFRCWCDEWLRYPLCRRIHWHHGGAFIEKEAK